MRVMIAACAIIALCNSAEAKRGVLICRDPVAKTGCYYLDTPEGQALLAEQEAQAHPKLQNRTGVNKPGYSQPGTGNQPTTSTSNSTMTAQPTTKTLSTGATQMKPIKGPCPVGHPTC